MKQGKEINKGIVAAMVAIATGLVVSCSSTDQGLSETQRDTLRIVAIAALSRQYPQLTREEIELLLDVGAVVIPQQEGGK